MTLLEPRIERRARSTYPAVVPREGATPGVTTTVAAPPRPAPVQAPAVRWERIEVDCYRVSVADRAVGYIDVVGHLFVVLRGGRYDHAVEVAQLMDFRQAIRVLAPEAGA